MRRAHGKRGERPLWYLHPQRDGGTGWNQRLGEIGGRIVSEEFFGLVEGNPNFFLSRERDWKPGLPSRVEDNFTMGDLLRLVGEINPPEWILRGVCTPQRLVAARVSRAPL